MSEKFDTDIHLQISMHINRVTPNTFQKLYAMHVYI